MAISEEKCVLGVDSLEFLGHIVNRNGIVPTPKNLPGISDFKAPRDQKSTLRYLGMFNYCSLTKIGAVLQLLNTVATKWLGKGEKLVWTSELQKVFDNRKQRLHEHTLLVHQDLDAPLAVVTDTLYDGIGGAIQQFSKKRNCWQPLGFYSRHLTDAKKKWPAYHLELRAIQHSLRHFRDQVEGVNSLMIYTDHKPLTTSIGMEKPFHRTVHNMLMEVAAYTTDIRYKPGKANNIAESLSRPNLPTVLDDAVVEVIDVSLQTLDYAELARAQANDRRYKTSSPDQKPRG